MTRYLVSNQLDLFHSDCYQRMSIEDSISWILRQEIVQYDSETTGRDAHINDLLCMQFGSMDKSEQIVVDCTTVSPSLYKTAIEKVFLVGQNIKFDLKFLFKYNISPLRIYDTMIVEQLIYLGYPHFMIGASKDIIMKYAEYEAEHHDFIEDLKPETKKRLFYRDIPDVAEFIYNHAGASLKAMCWRYLHIDVDKTVRGQIIWRGLDDVVINYAANDVVYLADIMYKQLEICKQMGIMAGAELECNAVPAIAYTEWSGIRLSPLRWKIKMAKDWENLQLSIKEINHFVLSRPDLSDFTYVDTQGDLFTPGGFDLTPKVSVDWSSPDDVIKVAKALGFNTKVVDKKSGEEKDSAMEKVLKGQKGICDEFLRLYFGKGEPGDDDYFPGYSGSFKVVTSFGQGHLNAINPLTGRIHTEFKQLGAESGRMSCGSSQINTDLAKLKGLPQKSVTKKKHEDPRKSKKCGYPNIQQLPSDGITRGSFIADKDNVLADCDFSALESRLGADIYNEKNMIDEFLYGSGDMHSLCAKMVFHKELEGIDVKDVKKKRPDLRKKVKPIEFSQQFGGSEYAIASSLGCSIEEAREFKTAYDSGFSGITSFKIQGAKFVKSNGYVLMNRATGHRMTWWDFDFWKKEQNSYTSEFWDNYKLYHKGTKDNVARRVSLHAKAGSKWERMALNAPTQGSGACIIKLAATNLFKWIIENGYFNVIKICAIVHDELLVEFPRKLKDTFPKVLERIMFDAAAVYCKKVPIPAEAEIAGHWLH